MIDFVMFFIKMKDVAAKQESLFIMLLMVLGFLVPMVIVFILKTNEWPVGVL